MNEKLEEILELPTPKKVGIAVGAVLIIVAGFWIFGFNGLRGDLSDLDEQIGQLQSEIAEKSGMVQNLEKYEAEVDRLDIELKKAVAELPDKEEIHLLLAKISDKARDAGLEIKLFKPGNETKKDFYAEVPVEIEVDGTFHQVATFFDEVGHLERLVNLSNFNLAEPSIGDEGAALKTKVLATTFRFLDESERVNTQEEEKSKKRRGAKEKGKKKGKGGEGEV